MAVLVIDGFIKLQDIINNFIISYTGPGKLIPDAKRTDVIFHSRRCLQEFAYETLKSKMIDVTSTPVAVGGVVTFKMPTDYIIVTSIESGAGFNTQLTRSTSNPPTDTTSYFLNYTNRTIVFSSTFGSQAIKVTYLSNSLTNDEDVLIPKLAEEALYACIIYAVLANREGTDPNLLQRLLIEKIDKLERSKSRLVFTSFL